MFLSVKIDSTSCVFYYLQLDTISCVFIGMSVFFHYVEPDDMIFVFLLIDSSLGCTSF